MMKHWIYSISLLMAAFCLSCDDEELVKNSSVGDEEVCATLRFDHTPFEKIDIKTRATLNVVPESRVLNMFVYAFTASDGKRIYAHYFDNEEMKESSSEVETATGNCWFVSNMSEGEDPTSNPTNGIIRIKARQATNVNIYLMANIDADMVNISPEKLNLIHSEADVLALSASLNQETISRNGYFPMTAVVKGIDISSNGEITANTTALLERLDAKIEVNTKIATGHQTTIEDPDGTVTKQIIKEFVPETWRVVNLPKGCYAIGKEGTDYEETGYFSTEAVAFETIQQEAYSYTDSQGATINTTRTINGFSFYMMENRETGKKSVNSDYHLRDKRNKNASGAYDNTNGLWEYAPEMGTYLEIKGQVKMDVDVSSEAKTQHLAADVTYYIHLGDFANDKDNYSIERNTQYTYTITIKGVKNIEVEVKTSNPTTGEATENESGATGMVYVAREEIHTFDAHYGQRVYRMDAAAIDPDNVTWYVSTPFSEGVPEVIGGVEIPAGKDYKWVQFMLNQWADENLTTYSQNNQSYPGYKGNNNQKERSDSLMDVVEFTKLIREEVKKLKAGQSNIFRKEFDQDWFDLYLKNNGLTSVSDAVKNDRTQVWWRDRIYATIFVDEFYYEEDPITGNKREGLWKEFVNQPNRVMHILCDNQESLDGASSSTGSIVTIRQRSIQTPYNIESANTAWGCETVDETAESYLWFYREDEPLQDLVNIDDGPTEEEKPSYDNPSTYASSSAGNTSSLNGLYNTAKLWGYTADDVLSWSDYVEYNRPNDYQKDGEDFPRYWMKDGKAVLLYTPLMRNRDNDGDGYIDADEMHWYIASLEQIYGLYIGDQGISPDAQLYSAKRRAYTKDDRYAEDHPLKRRYKYLEHIVSSTQSGKAYTPVVVWAEEGVSTSYYRQEFGWSMANQGAQSIRCIRNLGMKAPTADDILDPDYTPEELITVEVPAGTISSSSVFTFDLTRVNPKSLRNYYSSHELEPTDEYDEMSRPYKKFETGLLYSTGDYDNLYNTLVSGKSPVTDTDYRVPNIREAALMMLYLNNYSNWWGGEDNYIHSATYYSRGSKADESMKTKEHPTWALGVNRFSSVGQPASQTRAVKDIPVD